MATMGLLLLTVVALCLGSPAVVHGGALQQRKYGLLQQLVANVTRYALYT